MVIGATDYYLEDSVIVNSCREPAVPSFDPNKNLDGDWRYRLLFGGLYERFF
nr:MAG TPA: hypothetical protein [Caudoviricetes sp.]